MGSNKKSTTNSTATVDQTIACIKCSAKMEPMYFVNPVPSRGLVVDEDDPDYEPGAEIDARGSVRIGLKVCRECQEIIGTWIESSSAPFLADWGEKRTDDTGTLDDKIKTVLVAALNVADGRCGDISTEEGDFAATSPENMIELQRALCDAFGTTDDVVFSEIRPKIEAL